MASIGMPGRIENLFRFGGRLAFLDNSPEPGKDSGQREPASGQRRGGERRIVPRPPRTMPRTRDVHLDARMRTVSDISIRRTRLIAEIFARITRSSMYGLRERDQPGRPRTIGVERQPAHGLVTPDSIAAFVLMWTSGPGRNFTSITCISPIDRFISETVPWRDPTTEIVSCKILV